MLSILKLKRARRKKRHASSVSIIMRLGMLLSVLYCRASFSWLVFLSHRMRLDNKRKVLPQFSSPAPSYHRSADFVGKLPGHLPADEEAAGTRLLLRGGGAGNGRVYRREPAVGVARSVFVMTIAWSWTRGVVSSKYQYGHDMIGTPTCAYM